MLTITGPSDRLNWLWCYTVQFGNKIASLFIDETYLEGDGETPCSGRPKIISIPMYWHIEDVDPDEEEWAHNLDSLREDFPEYVEELILELTRELL